MFDAQFIHNKAMTEQSAAFNPPHPEYVGSFPNGKPRRTGVQVQEDGSLLFSVYAPPVSRAEVRLTAFPDVCIPLEKSAEDIFQGHLAYNPQYRGPQDIKFYLDGQVFLHPYIPAHYRTFQLVNYVEIPDPESAMILLRDVPHGQVVREIYFSKAMNAWERCLVYLPPQYRQGERLPVLYLQHGATENENEWVYMGKMPYIMDNLLADGECVPFIVVMNDGMERGPEEGMLDFDTFGRMLLEDCIPFIEENYRVRPGKENRAMAGLSLGSMQTSVLGLTHPELFDYLGLFSGFMRLGDSVGTDFANWPHLAHIAEYPAFIQEQYKLFFRAMGEQDVYFKDFQEDSATCTALGMDQFSNYAVKTYPEMTHDWGAFRRGFRDFARMIFR